MSYSMKAPSATSTRTSHVLRKNNTKKSCAMRLRQQPWYRTTKAFYAASHDRWRTMLEQPKGGADSDDKFRRNMPQEVVSDLGRRFTSLILDSYENSRMSLSDVSRFLGIRAEGVQKVREIMLRS